MAPRIFTPQLLRRGLEIFLLISLIGFIVIFIYGKDPKAALSYVTQLKWGWLLVGLLLASMDWIGGGIRLWVLARVVHPDPPLKVALITTLPVGPVKLIGVPGQVGVAGGGATSRATRTA